MNNFLVSKPNYLLRSLIIEEWNIIYEYDISTYIQFPISMVMAF